MPIAPRAGEFLGARPQETAATPSARNPFALEDQEALHPLVRWGHDAAATLHQEKRPITQRMERNQQLYDGNHWTSPRAPWKNASVINYCAWVADQWAAILADNKPKVTFETYLQQYQTEADTMTAAWEDIYLRDGWQATIEDAILMARIEMVSYLHPTFDPLKTDGLGDISLKAVSGTQVFVNREATSIEDATLVMYEYRLPVGEILFKWPHLTRILRMHAPDPDMEGHQGSEAELTPPTLTSSNQHASVHQAPYYAHPNPPNDRGSGGVLVREFWTRPKGPNAQIEVERFKWTAGNKPATRKKFLRFEDGHLEPLQTVVTEGNVVYELPLTDAMLMEHISEQGGLQVMHVADALEAERETVKVPLFPTGRRTIIVGDFVADDGMNPFGHGHFPFIPIHAYRSRKTYYGASDIDRIATLQEYLNRLYSLLLDAAILTSNPLWLIPTEANIADEDVTNAPGAILRGDQMTVKTARREPGPDMPSYVKDLLSFTISQIREISGLSETATGGKFKGQQAAETVSMYQEAAGVRFRQGIRNVEHAIIELGFQFIGLVKQFYTQPRLLQIRNAVGDERTISFLGSDIGAPLFMKAKSGAMLPTSPSARLNLYMQMMNTPAIDLPEIWRQMQESGMIDSATALQARMQRYAKSMGLPDGWMAPGLMALVMGGQKKGSKKGNSGRSARSTTPGKALRNIA